MDRVLTLDELAKLAVLLEKWILWRYEQEDLTVHTHNRILLNQILDELENQCQCQGDAESPKDYHSPYDLRGGNQCLR